jgi:dUTP pyrophosphatase
MKIRVKYQNKETEQIRKISKGDWIDLRASETTELKQGEWKLIPLGIAVELPEGYESHIVPRSSTYKNFGIIQANHMGVVDNSYCGDNDWWYLSAIAMRDTVVHQNDRICQFRIAEKQPEFDIEIVEQLNNADRGGIGSTGIK